MSFLEPQDTMAKMFALLETPEEGAVCVFRFELTRDLPANFLQEAILGVCKENVKLRSQSRWSEENLIWDELYSPEQALEKVWLTHKFSAEELYAYRIVLGQGPAWKIAQTHAREVFLIAHHSLTDGFGMMRLVSTLLRAADHLQMGKPAQFALHLNDYEKNAKFLRIPLVYRVYWIFSALYRRSKLARNSPPILLGERVHSGKVKTHFESRVFTQAQFIDLKTKLKTDYPGVTLNDWILAAMVRAVESFLSQKISEGRQGKGGSDRLAIYIPMDVRGSRPVGGPLWNPVTGAQIDLLPKDRTSLKTLLSSVARQTRRIKNPYSASASFDFAKLVIWFVRRFKLDLAHAGPDSWRHACTVCLSNGGKIEYLDETADLIEGVYGAPPTTAPVGFLVGIVSIQGKLCFGFNCADYCLAPSDAQILIALFMENLTRFNP